MGSTLVDKILENFAALFPFLIIYDYERGVCWTWGKNPVELDAGFHWKIAFSWKWPFVLFRTIEKVAVVDDVIGLPVQSVITLDKKLVCFSASFGYRIEDPVAHFCNVQDFETSTTHLAMGHLAERVREQKLEDLEEGLKKLEASAKGTLETRTSGWGTKILWVKFTDFAEVPNQYRIFGDGPSVLPIEHA